MDLYAFMICKAIYINWLSDPKPHIYSLGPTYGTYLLPGLLLQVMQELPVCFMKTNRLPCPRQEAESIVLKFDDIGVAFCHIII
jgi:hypothetical protein